MIIKSVIIKNFRNIKHAKLNLQKHSLMVGINNVGKSTILEALNLVLGPDRISSPDAINEHDFFQSKYIDDDDNPILINIECILTGLTDKDQRLFRYNLEFWDEYENKVVFPEVVGDINNDRYVFCLRVKFIGYYSKEEDEFKTETFFATPVSADDEGVGKYETFSKRHKREIGYLFIRVLRTGSRAFSLERGSLLDIILRIKEIKPSSWREIIKELNELGSRLDDSAEFRGILKQIEDKVHDYTPLSVDNEKSTEFKVTNLTRQNLRHVLNLFISTEPSNILVPYKNTGSGTINILLLALMTIVADLKRENNKNVIFAMEEPEIAIPPYTQRRIIDELLSISNQLIITSHSPYVAERFIGKNISVIQNTGSELLNKDVGFNSIFKEKVFRKDFRNKFAEGILSRGVVAVEGASDEYALYQTSSKLVEFYKKNPKSFNNRYVHLDIGGIIIIDCESCGDIEKIGTFFSNLNLKTYAFYDKNKGLSINDEVFDHKMEIDYPGIEKLLVHEIPENRLREFLPLSKEYSDYRPHVNDKLNEDLKDNIYTILKEHKREGYAARLIGLCKSYDELPATIVDFLITINDDSIKQRAA